MMERGELVGFWVYVRQLRLEVRTLLSQAISLKAVQVWECEGLGCFGDCAYPTRTLLRWLCIMLTGGEYEDDYAG